jgi:hypothetical protein
MDKTKIREHMEVLGSCGKCVGIVDKVEGLSIKLTKDGPGARGFHHYIPLSWVSSVDQAVHISKACQDAQEEWEGHPVQEGEYPPDSK